MKLGNCILFIGEKGSNVQKRGVTPAEVLFLVIEHSGNAGRCAVEMIAETETEVSRQPAKEIGRLRSLYSQKKLGKVFPPGSKLPETFEEAIQSGLSFSGAFDKEPLVEMNLLG